MNGLNANDHLGGGMMNGAGDVNGDGLNDLAIGAPGALSGVLSHLLSMDKNIGSML